MHAKQKKQSSKIDFEGTLSMLLAIFLALFCDHISAVDEVGNDDETKL